MKRKALIFRSLADENRLGMLCLLMQAEELCVCEFQEILGINQSKASRHLRYLYNAGWVKDRRVGVKMNYRLSLPPGLRGEKQWQGLLDLLASDPGARRLHQRLRHWLESKSDLPTRPPAPVPKLEKHALG
ncbi:MAG: ArsR/SmtB family transcription factor [Desulfobaccales bacterium]